MKSCLVLFFIFLGILVAVPASYGQHEFFSAWEQRVRTTTSCQPSWPTPLVTASSGIVELFRPEFVRQLAPAGTTTWNYGNSKGVALIPWYRTEIDILAPPYIEHNSAAAKDGFGDFSMFLKYRLAAADDKHGAYAVSFAAVATLPTGSYKNGSTDATITPTLFGGKGFGRVDVQSSLGATLPTGDTNKLGRPILWNTVAQYHLGKLLWPEVEANTTYFYGGPNDGRVQNLLTPGLLVSKFKLERDPDSRLSLLFGAGIQIATSHYHAYNHALVFSSRLNF